MSAETCVSETDLKAFALGHLDEDRSEEIAVHLSACTRCEETIAGFDDTADSMLEAVREAAVKAEPVPIDGDPVLQKIINPWSGLTQNASSATTGEWIRDYELLEPLGHGGMGTVYKAIHARLQRPVAIKLLPSRRLRDPDAVARFEREMKAIGRLDHPAIVRATDAGESDGTHFIAMDFVDGIDLSKLIKLTGPMDTANACEVVRQAALGLQYAHEQGLIHRDVKPSNLMIEISPSVGWSFLSVAVHDGQECPSYGKARVKLLDLGLALFGAASEAVDELTTVGQLMGTLDYMAPEQADNSHDVDARADVYSLGATLFKLLTGTAPYETADRRSPLQKMKALATIDAPSVKTRRPALPDDVTAVVDRMLLRDPAGRFQTAAEVAAAVAPFCTGSSLAELAHRAMQLRQSIHHAPRDEPQSSHHAPRDEPNHQPSATKASFGDRPPAPHTAAADLPTPPPISPAGRPPGRLITRSVMATLGGILLLAVGILIRLKTDTGTLTIESSSNSIPVKIRQGHETVKELTLTAGTNEIILRSGQYEITVPTEYDSVTIENGTVQISRGDVWLAKVTQESDRSEAEPEVIASSETTNALTASSSLPSIVSTPSTVQTTIASQPSFANPVEAVEYLHFSQRFASLLEQADEAWDRVADQSRLLGPDHPNVQALKDSGNRVARDLDETRARLGDMLAREAVRSNKTEPAAGPVYEGKTFDQWTLLTRTERSIEELTKAVDAIGILGRGERDRDAAKAILAVIEQQYDFVDPQTQTDEQSKLMIIAIRSVRGLNCDETVRAIAEDFSVRKPSVHEFVLSGLLLHVDTIYRGKSEPLASKLRADEELVDQLIQLSDKNSGDWSPEEYPTFAYSIRSGTDRVFQFVVAHVGKGKPSVDVEAYLRKIAVDPSQISDDEQLPRHAVAAATMLARHSPEELHARIFVRAIQDGMKTPRTISGAFGAQPDPAILGQSEAWQGLSLLGKHAEPAVPFMLEILSSSPEADSILGEPSDLSIRTDEMVIQSSHQVSMRLFAVEVLASSGTQDVKALEILRAELKLLIGQEPTDGPFEIVPGRLSFFLAPEKMIGFSYPGLSEVHPQGVSPIDIEMTNSCLLAWKALTGKAPRFAEASLGALTSAERPPGSTIEYMPKILPGR